MGWICYNYFPFLLAIPQVAIHTADVADTMNAIEITGAESAKNYIPIKREGSEPSRLPHAYSVLYITLPYTWCYLLQLKAIWQQSH